MVYTIKLLTAIFLPWMALLMEDNPGGALVALVLQVTVIGWPFASIWAYRVVKRHHHSEKAGETDEEE